MKIDYENARSSFSNGRVGPLRSRRLVGKWRHGAACAVFLGLVIFPSLEGSAQRSEKMRGVVWDVRDNNRFELRGGRVFEVMPDTRVKRGWDVYSGRLRIGWEVEVVGQRDSSSEVLRAETIQIKKTGASGSVKGEAVIERVSTVDGHYDGHYEVIADGRLLRLGVDVERLEDGPKGVEAVSPKAAKPGDIIRYRGRWTLDGFVEVVRAMIFANTVEPGERELEQEFIPAVQMSATDEGGRVIVRAGSRRFRLSANGRVQDYLQKLGRSLIPSSQRATADGSRGRQFNFMLAEESQPQALAYPGGTVVVNTGLLAFAENEAQVAFVIGHEIAHVVEEHAWRERRFHRSKSFKWATGGLGYLVERIERSGYDRASEDQADRLALQYMVRAGFDPREGYRFLEKIGQLGLEVMTLGWFDSHRPIVLRKRSVLSEIPHIMGRSGSSLGKLTRDSVLFRRMRLLVPSQSLAARPQTGVE